MTGAATNPAHAPGKGPVLVAVATRAEARLMPPIAGRLHLVRVGPGAHATGPLTSAIADQPAAGLVSFGFAGGLDPQIMPGTILVPRRVRESAGRLFVIDPAWQASVVKRIGHARPCSERDLLTVNAIVGSSVEKHRLGQRSGAVAADLESGRLAAIAADFGLPFLVLRIILDGADDALPARSARLLTPAGSTRPISAAITLLSSPRLSWHLLSRYRDASRGLRAALAPGMSALLDPPRPANGTFAGAPSSPRAE